MKPDDSQLGIYVDTNEDQQHNESDKKEADKILDEWLADQRREAKDEVENSPSIPYLKQKQKLEMAILEKLDIREEVIELLSLASETNGQRKTRELS